MSDMRDVRLDAGETVYFKRQLEFIDTTTYGIKFPALKGRQLVPTMPGLPEWAQVYTFRQVEEFGEAKVIDDYADDLPSTDVNGKEYSRQIFDCGASYRYSIKEIRAGAATGMRLDEMRARACRRIVETKIDSILATGSTAHGLEGILKLTDANSYTLGDKAAGGKTWGKVGSPNATADEIVADLMGIAAARNEATLGVFSSFTIILPIEQYNLAAQMKMGLGAETTPLAFAKANSEFISEVTSWYKAKSASSTAGTGGNNTRMACYPKDPEVLAGLVPQEFQTLPPQQRNLAFVINALGACGGVVCRYPVAVAYGDGL